MDFSIALETLRRILDDTLRMLPHLAIALVVFGLFFLVARVVRTAVRRVNARRRGAHALGLVLGRLAQWAIVLFGLLVAATIVFPSFRPGDLVTLLGLGSVAIGFAFKDIFQNFLAGILILVTRPFRVGDEIVVGSFEGKVEEIQTRATYLRTYDGRRVVIPNSDLYTEKVVVNTAFAYQRTEFDVGIGYGDDVERARSLILEAMRGAEHVLDHPEPDVLLVNLDASSVNLRARWWSPPDILSVLRAQDEVLGRIKASLVANGIDLPFPTRQILFHDQTEETDGDRRRQREGWPAGPDGEAPAPRRLGQAVRAAGEREPPPDG